MLPTDFSEASHRAADLAANLAKVHKAELLFGTNREEVIGRSFGLPVDADAPIEVDFVTQMSSNRASMTSTWGISAASAPGSRAWWSR
jgi:nucleotide-binding universal stress UspA family protein